MYVMHICLHCALYIGTVLYFYTWLFDHSGHDDQLLVQIYNITHCPTYWLQLAMCQCEHLLKVIQSKIDKVI